MVWRKKIFLQDVLHKIQEILQYTKISISCSHTPWPVRAKTLYITCLGGYVREIFIFICGSNLNSLDHGGGFGFNLRQC